MIARAVAEPVTMPQRGRAIWRPSRNRFDSIEAPDPLNSPAQLDDLRAMMDGWLDGDGIAPPKDGLDWLCAQFEMHYPRLRPAPLHMPHVRGLR